MRICVNIPVWGRSGVFRKTLKALRGQETRHEVEIVCAVSQDDPEIDENMELCQVYDCEILATRNRPLSNKANNLCYASRGLRFEYLMILGSDDIVSSNFIEESANNVIDGCINTVGWGWSDLYMYDTQTEQTYYWAGYGKRRQESIGAGRMLRRDVVHSLGWKLYDDGIDANLDRSLTQRLAKVGVELPYGPMPEGVYLVDCKDEYSMTQIENFPEGSLTCVDLPESMRGRL